MKKNTFLYAAFAAFMTLFTGTAQSYVKEMDVWSNGHQNLFCLSDRHIKSEHNTLQRQALIQQANKDDGLIIVEDMLDYNGDKPQVQSFVDDWKKEASSDNNTQLLLGLSDHLQRNNIQRDNVEFRQEKIASMLGLSVSSQDVFNTFNKLETQLKNSSNKQFSACYQNILEKRDNNLIRSCKKFFDRFKSGQQSLKELLPAVEYDTSYDSILTLVKNHTTMNSYEKKKTLLLLYDIPLIDAHIIRSIEQNKHCTNIYVCAGGAHINNINKHLEALGYKYIDYIKGDQPVANEPAALDLEKAFGQAKSFELAKPIAQPKADKYLLYILCVIAFALCGLVLILFKKMNLSFLVILAALAANSASAHIYRMDCWNNGQQTIYTLGDFHITNNKDNQNADQQRIDIICEAKKRNAVILVEDIHPNTQALMNNPIGYDTNKNYYYNANVINELKNDSVTPPIFGLVPCCHDAHTPAVNIEFRHSNNASGHGKNVSAKDSFAVSQNIRNEICTYNDGEVLNNYYAKTIGEYDRCIAEGAPFFDQMQNCGSTNIRDLMSQMKNNRGTDAVLRYLGWSNSTINDSTADEKNDYAINFYDLNLVDMKILHEIHQHTSQPIFVCAGALHIRGIAPVLEKLGYKKLATHGQKDAFESGKFEPDTLDVAQTFKQLDEKVPAGIPVHNDRTNGAANQGILLIIVLALIVLFLLTKSMKTVQLGILILLGLSTQAYGHIFKISHWKNGQQNIYAFYDHHDNTKVENQTNGFQRNDILAKATRNDAHVIIEDMGVEYETLIKDPVAYNPNINYEFPKETIDYFTNDQIKPSIVGLSFCCTDKKIPCTNVEYRQAALLSNMGKPVSASNVMTVTEKIRNTIASYDDTPMLNGYYKEIVKYYDNFIEQCPNFFNQLKNETSETLKECIPKLQYTQELDQMLKSLGWPDEAISNLSKNEKKQTILGLYHKYFVDAQIIHTVYEKRNEQNIFICAGAAHIERTLPILQKLGYEHQASEGNEYYNPDTQQFSEPDTLDVAQTFKQLDEKVPAGIPVHNDRMNGAIVWLLLVFASMLFILHRNRKQKRYIISGIQ